MARAARGGATRGGTAQLPARVVLVVPLAPAPAGNGLAMRCAMWLDALAAAWPVDLVVAPVAGPADVERWAATRARSVHPVALVDDRAGAEASAVAVLADPWLRERLAATHPLPWRARLAPPTLAADVAGPLGRDEPTVVVVVREHLVPLGLALARRLGAVRVVVDLDDDAEALARALGDTAEADAHGRLARAWLPDADAVTLASAAEARAVAARYDLDAVTAAPNAVAPVEPTPPPPGADRLLFVGNLTYGPNIEAARELAAEVLPALRERRPTATATLVGEADPQVARLGSRPAVVVTGAVAGVAPFYAGADVVVVPLRHGAGTRIKVLEAFAHRRPVVATPAALAGLDVADGAEVLVASSARELAAAADAVLADPALAASLVDAASATLASRYAPAVIAPRLRQVAGGPGRVEP